MWPSKRRSGNVTLRILYLAAVKVATIEMNDKLSETEDAKAEMINKLVMDSNTLEKM